MKLTIPALLAALVGSVARAESPQNFVFEARLGWYHPRIDSEPGLTLVNGLGPYALMFGDKPYPLFELELDYQLFGASTGLPRLFGTLGFGLAVGHFIAVGHGVYAKDPGNDAAGLTGQPSSDPTSLRLVPIRGLVVWRVDELWRRWSIPFAPYLKLGFGPTLYWVDNGKGQTSWDNRQRGAGSRWGYEAAGGVGFLLDFLDPMIARDFDTDWGVNHTYVFAEFRLNQTGSATWPVNLPEKPGFDLSDKFFTFGLAFEF